MADEFLDQQKVWDYRAAHWDNWGFGEPLAPNQQELEYQQSFIKPGAKVLVLGATKGLCEAMIAKTNNVTAVDFSPEAIKLFQIQGVDYVCSDWIAYLENYNDKFDNIVTDNGLLCLEFPGEWRRIIQAINKCLEPNGVFCSRFFLSTETPAKSSYDNPNLSRILPAMERALTAPNWTIIKPAHDKDPFPARYVFPNLETVKDLFSEYSIVSELIPEYEEGEHFVTIAFRKL